jgi:hypothetical protein
MRKLPNIPQSVLINNNQNRSLEPRVVISISAQMDHLLDNSQKLPERAREEEDTAAKLTTLEIINSRKS